MRRAGLDASTRGRAHRLATRNRRVAEHRGLVLSIAGHYAAHSPEPRDDLEQVGLLGLIRAADLYDNRLAVPFTAYARLHVRGAILHYLRDTAPMVRVPRRVQERQHQRRRLQQGLEASLGRPASDDELSEAFGISLTDWHQQLAPWEERLRQELEVHQAYSTPECDGVARSTGVLSELRALGRRERLVVQAVVLEGCSLRTVAQRMDSSAATVHRLLHRALAELRERLGSPSAAGVW